MDVNDIIRIVFGIIFFYFLCLFAVAFGLFVAAFVMPGIYLLMG